MFGPLVVVGHLSDIHRLLPPTSIFNRRVIGRRTTRIVLRLGRVNLRRKRSRSRTRTVGAVSSIRRARKSERIRRRSVLYTKASVFTRETAV